MEMNSLRGMSASQLQAMVEGKKAIVLSPRSRVRNLFLADFTQEEGSYLYRLLPQHSSLSVFLLNIAQELAEFVLAPKEQASSLLEVISASPTIIGLVDMLIVDLKKAGISVLILDEFDRLSVNADSVEFFERLVEALPRSIRLVINGYSISYQPWNRLVQSGLAVVLGEEQATAGEIYSQTETEKPHIEVYAFGSGRIYVNGLPVEEWDGPLPRNLFYYFTDNPMVTREQIFETFWPELNTKEATNVFHVTKRKISERLGYELTNYSGGFYRPNVEHVKIHSDVAEFENHFKAARSESNPKKALKHWQEMIRIYRAEFLHSVKGMYAFDMPWMNERRDALKAMYVEALVGVARSHRESNELEQAAHYFIRAMREEPLREDIYRDVMSIYGTQGEYEEAIKLYKQLDSILYRKLKIRPSPVTHKVYEDIQAKM